MQFLACQTPEKPLGIYPLVDRADKLRPLFEAGITTAQIRIKDLTGATLEQELADADALAKAHQARLFINDYWQIALKLDSYGVHLGQEDLAIADLHALSHAGIRLGISSHNPSELRRALAIQPSYIAIGPIFETSSKHLTYHPVGLANFRQWTQGLDLPVVAIGGIPQQHLAETVQAGADGIAMINGLHLNQTNQQKSLKTVIETFNQAYQNWSFGNA
ncbi:thiamine phosphate synthase [Hydrogenovibrio sp. SC-1]|uniref:thiamine phosphate synthase n=1 Tax=Hydrogenovibrio sp. SC-1 TaxID=2065820 RepID=UPI000C7B0032|nr:thiamine phosphate synthase [Hydrogenovibrio sp. SC-1]PLA75246.1 thiamine phosphate synthase [Hydrogenovibrio sp. SC-1]